MVVTEGVVEGGMVEVEGKVVESTASKPSMCPSRISRPTSSCDSDGRCSCSGTDQLVTSMGREP